MAYTIGYCEECNVIYYDPPRELKPETTLAGTTHAILKFYCRVCKEETEFNLIPDLSDW